MKEKLVNILFKEEDAKLPVLQPGTMTLTDLYGSTQLTWVTNANGDMRQIKRRDFHIVAGESRGTKRRAIVCDIDGCLNLIDGAYLQLTDGSTAQWTEIDKTVLAKAVDSMFLMLKSFAEAGYDILFLTARGESQRIPTEMFLAKHLKKSNATLFMRGMTVNDVPAPELKAVIMQAAILPYYNVEWFIEDCPKNVAMMREVCPQIPVMHILRN